MPIMADVDDLAIAEFLLMMSLTSKTGKLSVRHGENKVLLVPAQICEQIGIEPGAFREPLLLFTETGERIAPLMMFQVRKMSIAVRGEGDKARTVALAETKGLKWRLASPVDARADSGAVSMAIQRLVNLAAAGPDQERGADREQLPENEQGDQVSGEDGAHGTAGVQQGRHVLRGLAHAQGEYRCARANFRKEVPPPVSGIFDNPFREGLGGLARAELWGMVAPGDPVEARLATAAVARRDGPCYLRLGKAGEPVVHALLPAFEIGRAIRVREGNDATLISTGGMLSCVVETAEALAAEHEISARVLSMHTLKPLDVEAVLSAARETDAVVTVEEHSVVGGLGSAVADVVATMAGPHAPLHKYGVPDRVNHLVGQQEVLRRMAGDLVEIVPSLLRKNRCTAPCGA